MTASIFLFLFFIFLSSIFLSSIFPTPRSAFVNGQESIIQRHGQQRHGRSDRRAKLTSETSVGLLSLFQLANQHLVPFLPRLDVPLKQRLGLVIALIFHPTKAGGA